MEHVRSAILRISSGYNEDESMSNSGLQLCNGAAYVEAKDGDTVHQENQGIPKPETEGTWMCIQFQKNTRCLTEICLDLVNIFFIMTDGLECALETGSQYTIQPSRKWTCCPEGNVSRVFKFSCLVKLGWGSCGVREEDATW